jgi:N-acetyl-anhydromuramyl-L-alanine amidase AmpD
MSRTFPTNHHRSRALAVIAATATALAVTAALGAAAAASPHHAPARDQASRAAGHTVASSRAAGRLMAAYRAAARESGVPDSLLLAVGYSESRWETRGSAPSADGGYGLMNLTTRTFTMASAAGKAGQPSRRTSLQRTHYTLDEAARLLHVPTSTLKANDAENIRGAAAVLAGYARAQNGGRLPSTLGGWYGAVAAYSGATTSQGAGLFAGQVFGALRNGAALTTSDRQVMRLPASPGLHPDTGQLARLGLKPAAAASATVPTDCPATLNCDFIPAAYAEDSPTDPSDYGDYDIASRPQDLKIFSIVIHDTEESYADTLNTFTNPASFVSSNYVVRSSDGHVTEMLRPQNVPFAVGNWYYNTHSISIENEGFADQGTQWYTQAEYQSDAALVDYLAHRFGVPLDRVHIVGHDNVGGPTNAGNAAQHWDPGPYWDWNYFMSLVHHESESSYLNSQGSLNPDGHHVVTISPDYATNAPPLTDCDVTNPVALPTPPANFVYLHTAPDPGAPLLSDPTLHTDGSPGTTCAEDWGDKASAGDQYVIAGRQGHWTGIWYAGTIGWFYNPQGAGQTARYTGAWVVTPRPGLASVPVYGSAFPEASEYPPGVAVRVNDPLAYTIKAGQSYVTAGEVPDGFYNAVTFNSSTPYDHTVIFGKARYYEILLNHRIYYVHAADVMLKHLD